VAFTMLPSEGGLRGFKIADCNKEQYRKQPGKIILDIRYIFIQESNYLLDVPVSTMVCHKCYHEVKGFLFRHYTVPNNSI
jgi:hypothetical protein